jgi:hypothetical protein
VVDDHHNHFHKEQTGFFGFFECIDDQKIAHALLDEVTQWVKARGMNMLRGPMNPSTNHECGLLVEGFEHSPSIMMTYNPPYYGKLLESWGLGKSKDLFAYDIDGRTARFAERLMAQSERLKQRSDIVLREINMRDFEGEIERVLEIYNDAWEQNWGFVPMTPEEFRHMAKDLKAVLDPRLLLIAEIRGEPVAFALTLPDVNQAIAKVRDGKLFPTGLLKLLWYTKGPGNKVINRCRILTLGIKKAFRNHALGPLLYTEYFKRGPGNGYPVGEASWILDDNKAMNKALELMDGKRNKVYRIYDRALN